MTLRQCHLLIVATWMASFVLQLVYPPGWIFVVAQILLTVGWLATFWLHWRMR